MSTLTTVIWEHQSLLYGDEIMRLIRLSPNRPCFDHRKYSFDDPVSESVIRLFSCPHRVFVGFRLWLIVSQSSAQSFENASLYLGRHLIVYQTYLSILNNSLFLTALEQIWFILNGSIGQELNTGQEKIYRNGTSPYALWSYGIPELHVAPHNKLCFHNTIWTGW